MAALTRPTEATYVLHEQVVADTTDNEDHTFCGVMFPLECKPGLPIDHIAVKSIAVRGLLGPVTIWVSQDPRETHEATNSASDQSTDPPSRSGRNRPLISVCKKYWTKIYEQTHPPSIRYFKELELDTPLKLKPGEVRGIYVHSSLPGDQSIVYDNLKERYTHDDNFVRLYPGVAHLSNVPFGSSPPWGFGSSWRGPREFVGRVSFGVVYKLWNPKEHFQFGSNFQNATTTLFACQRKFESPLCRLPDDVIFYILNMCRWDWFEDDADQLLRRVAIEQQRQQQGEKTLSRSYVKCIFGGFFKKVPLCVLEVSFVSIAIALWFMYSY